jgi:membrane-associated phospholipid phosphatase
MLTTLGGLLISMWLFGRFVVSIEMRPGVALADPVLAMFEPRDVTVLTFLLIYSSIAAAVVHLAAHPHHLLLGMRAYTLMLSLRMLTMWSVPLDAPERIIPLTDPLVEAFTVSQTLLKDLFFSGHTSTSFLLYLTARNRVLKRVFLVCTVLIAGCVLIQHVHYFVDVVAAPFFAYGAFRAAKASGRLGWPATARGNELIQE